MHNKVISRGKIRNLIERKKTDILECDNCIKNVGSKSNWEQCLSKELHCKKSWHYTKWWTRNMNKSKTETKQECGNLFTIFQYLDWIKKWGKNRICEVVFSRNINMRSADGMSVEIQKRKYADIRWQEDGLFNITMNIYTKIVIYIKYNFVRCHIVMICLHISW